MAGEKLVQLLKNKSKLDNNIVFGEVVSIKPIGIKIGDRFIPEDLLYLSICCKPLKVQYKEDEIVLWSGIKIGDKIVMIESNNNQLYYALEVYNC